MGATYLKTGKRSWRVAIYRNGERAYTTVRSEQDAKALVQHVHKTELAGLNVIEAVQKARTPVVASAGYPMLKDALPAWIDSQAQAGDIRASTSKLYRTRCQTWVYPHVLPDGRVLGDLPVNEVTREQIGSVIRKVKTSGRSLAVIEQIRNPLRTYYQHLIETKTLPGPNPAADLKYFIGKGAHQKARTSVFFTQQEGPTLMAAAEALHPRWAPFILTGLLAGLRWGESAALYKSDIDWKRGRLHVQRTVSDKGRRIEPCKDGEGRWVKVSKALLNALRSHVEAMGLEGQVNDWTPEQRQLVFPTKAGQPLGYPYFLEHVWRPLLAAAKLPYRKYHATRHTFATWLLSDGADLRWVQRQLGHASISQTADTYGHMQPDRHESAVERLDSYVQ